MQPHCCTYCMRKIEQTGERLAGLRWLSWTVTQHGEVTDLERVYAHPSTRQPSALRGDVERGLAYC